MRIDNWLRLSFVLAVLALLSVAVGHLALTDIFHAEGDVSLEWNAVRVCLAVIVDRVTLCEGHRRVMKTTRSRCA
jgi:hypothetical protein